MFGNSTYHEEALTTSVVDPYVSCAATSIWDESTTRASDSEYAYVDLGQRHFQAHTSADLICRVKLYCYFNYNESETLEGKSPLTFYSEKTNISADKCYFVYASTEDPNIKNDKVYFLKLNTTIIA